MPSLSKSFVGLVLVSSSALALAQTSFSVNVKDAAAAGVLSAVADVADVNLVVLGSARQRLSTEVADSNPSALLAELGKAAGLVHRQMDGVNVLSPQQCERAAEAAMPPLSNDPVSLNFQAVPPSTLLAILADMSNLRYADPGAAPVGQPQQLVTLRLKRVPAAVAYRLLSAVTGARLAAQPDGSYRIDEAPRSPCGALPVPKAANQQVGMLSPDSCPRKARDAQLGIKASLPCEPLEQFALDDLVVRGKILRPGGKPIALLEAPNGITYAARAGDSIGHQHGRILAIDPAGMTMREMRLDSLNFYREYLVRVDWTNTRYTVEKAAP